MKRTLPFASLLLLLLLATVVVGFDVDANIEGFLDGADDVPKDLSEPASDNNNSTEIGDGLLQARIVGGGFAGANDYPYWAGICETKKCSNFFCAGSLVHRRFVLTAAHCYERNPAWNIIINTNRNGWAQQGKSVVRTARRLIRHPNFDPSTLNRDFMLIELSSPVDNLPILPLNRQGPNIRPLQGEFLTVMGTGSVAYGGSQSQWLKEIDVQVFGSQRCKRAYPQGYTDSTMFCAGLSTGGRDACQGDSGAPIIQRGVQIGIVSWGSNCGLATRPGVYSRISFAVDWIETTMCGWPGCQSGAVAPTPRPTRRPTPTPTPFPTPRPTPGQARGSEEVNLEIQLDYYAQDFGWVLKDRSGKPVQSEAPTSYSNRRSQMIPERVFLDPGTEYTLELIDSFGDGICCRHGNGYVSVVYRKTGAVLKEIPGSFGKGTVVSFTVPNPTPPAPAPPRPVDQSGCKDSRGSVMLSRFKLTTCGKLPTVDPDYRTNSCRLNPFVVRGCPRTCGYCGDERNANLDDEQATSNIFGGFHRSMLRGGNSTEVAKSLDSPGTGQAQSD